LSEQARYLVEKYVGLLLAYGYGAAGYMAINYLYQPETSHTLWTSLDRAIPLVPGWSFLYNTHFLMAFIVPFVVSDRLETRRAVSLIVLSNTLVFACFLLIPVHMERGPFEALVRPSESWAHWWLGFSYFLDTPRTCFPSGHITTVGVITTLCWRRNRRLGMAVGAYSLLIALSTLFVKQHYLADVAGAGGVLVASVGLVYVWPQRAAAAAERSDPEGLAA